MQYCSLQSCFYGWQTKLTFNKVFQIYKVTYKVMSASDYDTAVDKFTTFMCLWLTWTSSRI